MTGRWERRAVPLAWGIGLGSLVLLLASLVLLALDWKAIDSLGTAQAGYFLQVPIVGILGVLIAARRPRNPIGWLLLAISAISAIYLTADFLAMRGLLSGVSARGWVSAAAWLYNNTGTLGALLLGFVVLFFPTGRLLPGRRWRWAAWALVVGVATGTVSSMLALVPIALSPRLPVVPNPLGVPALNGVTNSSGLNNAPPVPAPRSRPGRGGGALPPVAGHRAKPAPLVRVRGRSGDGTPHLRVCPARFGHRRPQ